MGDKKTMPGNVRAKSRIRFEIGTGLYLSAETINRILPDVLRIKMPPELNQN
jgi:hypothetical protein